MHMPSRDYLLHIRFWSKNYTVVYMDKSYHMAHIIIVSNQVRIFCGFDHGSRNGFGLPTSAYEQIAFAVRIRFLGGLWGTDRSLLPPAIKEK